MANRNRQNTGRRMDYNRGDRNKSFGRTGVSPWQAGGPTSALPTLLPLAGSSTEATLALANNLISNLLQSRQNTVPSLLDMPIRRDFVQDMGRYDRGYGSNRMGNQGNFRRTTGTYNRAGERINTNRKPFRPNDGQRNRQSSPKKDADSKAKVKSESNEESKDTEGGDKTEDGNDAPKEKEGPKTRFDDIDSQYLRCHICNKSMWDGRSFENHLSGRAHAIMMQKTAESYALTADTMRQEFKIREMKRTRKSGQQTPRDFYCAMCDLYAADGAIHRTTVGHRKLKKYLHPACTSCHKEMPTRIELDEHRLTTEHLRNVQEKQEVTTKPKPEVMVISTLQQEQSYVRDDRQRKRRSSRDEAVAKDQSDETKDNDADDGQDAQEDKEEKTDKEDVEVKKESPDNENTVVDYNEGDDLNNFSSDMLPVYSTERGVGRSFLSEFSCVQCRLCRKLLDTEETAEVHLRTWRHHQLFVRMLQDKTKKENADSGKRAANPSEDTDDSGNFKRRKTTPEHESEQESKQNGDENVEMKEEIRDDDEEMPLAEIEAEGDDNWEKAVDDILADESVETKEVIEKETPKVDVVKAKPKSTPRSTRTATRGRKYN